MLISFVKQHTHEKYNNAVNYKVKLALDGPVASFEMTSEDPNLSLRPLVQVQPDVREEDLCKGKHPSNSWHSSGAPAKRSCVLWAVRSQFAWNAPPTASLYLVDIGPSAFSAA
jgi:hypothetical protein